MYSRPILISVLSVFSSLFLAFALFFRILRVAFSLNLSITVLSAVLACAAFLAFKAESVFREVWTDIFYPKFCQTEQALIFLKNQLSCLSDIKEFVKKTAGGFSQIFEADAAFVILKPRKTEAAFGFPKKEAEKLVRIVLKNNFISFPGFLTKKKATLLFKKAREKFLLEAKEENNVSVGEEVGENNVKETEEAGLFWSQIEAEVLIPVFCQKKAVGALVLRKKSGSSPFALWEARLGENFIQEIGIFLENALFYTRQTEEKEELEKFYKLAINRELKMHELKKEIRRLKKEKEELQQKIKTKN